MITLTNPYRHVEPPPPVGNEQIRTAASIGSAGTWVASSGTLLAAIQTEDDGVYGIESAATSAMFVVPADFADPGAPIQSISVRVRMKMATVGDNCTVSNQLRNGAGVTNTHASIFALNSTEWTEYEWVWNTDPGGALWTLAAANDIARCYIDPVAGALDGPLHFDVLQLILRY